MGRSARVLLLIAAGLTALFAACAPDVSAVPCNADEDCALHERCLRGICAEGEPLGPRPDAGRPPKEDAGAPDDLDAGEPPLSDGGSLETDAGELPSDAGESDGGQDASVPDDDAGEPPLDSGPDPILDAGPPGIVSFTASPSTVSFGASVTLSWETNELVSCALEGSDASLGVNGSLVLERPTKRPYLLQCTDEAGARYEEEIDVTVSCPSVVTLDSLTIASDDDLALFPTGSCVDVTGDVVITGISATSLEALYGLRSVGGSLSIGGNPNLERLDGLELLREVGYDLRLGFRPDDAGALLTLSALTSVHGLSALESIGIDFEIYSANSLVSLAGLERLTQIGDDFDVRDSPVLEGFGALRRLTTIGGLFEMSDNLALRTLGMPALEHIGLGIRLDDLPALTDLHAFSRIEGSLYAIYIHGCDSLTDLKGLEGILWLHEFLHVQFNASLKNIDGLSGLERAERVIIRRNNSLESADLPKLKEVRFTGSATCSGDYCDGDLVLERNPSLTHLGFESLTHVRRNLHIIENDALERVRGFSALTHVDNDLVVRRNERLEFIDGFASLTEVDDLLIEHNPKLGAFHFAALERVVDDVLIVKNESLSKLDGLPRLSRIGGDLQIEQNAQLSDFGPLVLEQVGDYPECVAGCRFRVRDNPHLPNSHALELLERVGRPVDEGDVANIEISGNGP